MSLVTPSPLWGGLGWGYQKRIADGLQDTLQLLKDVVVPESQDAVPL
jgi:hypothetical protein